MGRPSRDELEHWDEIQHQINGYLQEILFRIEWHYGDCRAPFRYPPEYQLIIHEKDIPEYAAVITLDMGEDETLVYKAQTPDILFQLIKEDIHNKFAVI